MSKIIRKNHNVSVLMYYIVCPAKYRRAVITKEADEKLKEVCLGIEARYEIKSITARKILEGNPEVKKALWGRNFWTDRYYVGTVGEHGNEEVIKHQ